MKTNAIQTKLSTQAAAKEKVEQVRTREQDILSEMQHKVQALRNQYNETFETVRQFPRSIEARVLRKRYANQLKVLVPLYRAARACFQPNKQASRTGYQVACHLYGTRMNAFMKDLTLEISMEPVFKRIEKRYPDLLDLPMFTVGIVRGHQALIEGKTLRESFSDIASDLSSKQSDARKAYAALIDSLTPEQVALVKRIAKGSGFPSVSIQLRHIEPDLEVAPRRATRRTF